MNHNIPAATITQNGQPEVLASKVEISQTSEVVKPLGGVALNAQPAETAELQTNSDDEHRRKVERAFFGSPDNLLKQIDSGEIGVNDTDFEERTPVMMMTSQGHAEAVRALIDRGADLNHIIMFQGRIPMSALDATRQIQRADLRKDLGQLLSDNGAKTGQQIKEEQERIVAEQSE